MTPIPNKCTSLLIPTMESTLLSLGRVRKESKLLRSYKSRGEGFLISCWLCFTFIQVCEYCTWPETLYNFILHFGNFEAHPRVRMCLALTDCLVKNCRDTLSPDMQLQFDIWVLHWWMSKPQMPWFMSHSEDISWKVRVGSTGGKPAMDAGLYH